MSARLLPRSSQPSDSSRFEIGVDKEGENMGLKSMMWKAVLALTALGFCSFGMNAQTSSNEGASTSSKASSGSGLAAADRRFMKKAAEGELADVELGQLATQKAFPLR